MSSQLRIHQWLLGSTLLFLSLHPECGDVSFFADALAPRFSTLGAVPVHQIIGQCAACSGPITTGEKYLEALGQKWHPEHLSCRKCNCPFPDGCFVPDPQQRDPYCEPCYHDLFTEKCQICFHPLVGKYYETFFGEKYCQNHENQLNKCSSCSRPISETLTQGGTRYPDGRAVCNLCRQEQGGTVDTPQQAQRILQQVWRDLARMGFQFGTTELPSIRLVEQTSTKTDGMTHIETLTTQTGQTVGESRMEMEILYGLPRTHFASIVAHELGHVYIHQWKLPTNSLPKQIEEGLCELLACTWLATQWEDPYAKYRYQAKVKNQDVVYGGGLRAALAAIGGNALESLKLFRYVHQHGRFP